MTLHHINVWKEHVSRKIYTSGVTITLREKCPNTEFFSGPNTGKYGPEKTPYLDTFHAV